MQINQDFHYPIAADTLFLVVLMAMALFAFIYKWVRQAHCVYTLFGL